MGIAQVPDREEPEWIQGMIINDRQELNRVLKSVDVLGLGVKVSLVKEYDSELDAWSIFWWVEIFTDVH